MKNFLKKLLLVLLELAVIAGVLWFIAEKRGIRNFSQIVLAPEIQEVAQVDLQEAPQVFPEVEQTETIQQAGNKKFVWNFKGVKYELALNLDQAIYAYYQKQPRQFSYQGKLPENWEETYYGMFLKINQKDQTISQLVTNLRELGSRHKLNDDQIVELAVAFVQAIAYDDSKANNILAKTGEEKMLYPFETLFEQKGVCSDKSLLTIAILREMGYGVAIFAYESENHMAVGVQCPKVDSTYGSGYCYIETTSKGHKIGFIPQIDARSSKTVEVAELATFEQENQQQANLQELGKMTMHQATVGKQYTGIAVNKKIKVELDDLKVQMRNLKTQLARQKNKINQEISQLEAQKKQIAELSSVLNPGKYSRSVSEYNDLLSEYKKNLKNYNQAIELYNQTVARYNKLIKP